MTTKKQPEFRFDRLNELMKSREMDPGKIEYLAGISRSMVHYLQKGEKPNVSAVIVGKLGQVLNCNVDYLLGLTDDPTPTAKRDVPQKVRQLQEVVDQLTSARQKEIFAVAQLFISLDAQTNNASVEHDMANQRYRVVMDMLQRKYGRDAVEMIEEELHQRFGVDDDQLPLEKQAG